MSKLWKHLIRPAAFRMDAEHAHELGFKALQYGAARLLPIPKVPEILKVDRFGLKFNSPIGIAAGFDKNGLVVDQLAALGFGSVEVGTVTYKPQPGNAKPRMFRLPLDNALINRLGFNNLGAAALEERLRRSLRNCVIGVNIGRNKDVGNEDAISNYLQTFELLHPHADYIAVNVSSPNTPDLRKLQDPENLDPLIRALRDRNRTLGEKPLLIKIAPDLTNDELEAIGTMAIRLELHGIIATNTTVNRLGLRSPGTLPEGGLSGRPLFQRSNEVISTLFKVVKRDIPIVGVGGVFNSDDAFEKIAAGASLVQVYTGFVYGGPLFASELNIGLARILEEKGFSSVDAAVGSRPNLG